MSSTLARLGVIVGAIVLASSSLASAETTATPIAQASTQPAPDFGSPPTGQIPILYNDQHVYARPDVLKKGRVLAALVKGGTIFIPLRSMFEQMGATVSYDPSTKTATVTKTGAEVEVTVGKPEVIINGESRPLDVPPMIYQGVVVVPVRVISESMGAYVQWVPDRRLVVVRYVPATPPPTEAPAPPPPPEAVPPPPKPTPNPLKMGGYFRSYYFTRQNATNNPGTQFNFSPGAKYNSNGVNQASWNSAIAPHVEWDFPGGGWIVGGTTSMPTRLTVRASLRPIMPRGRSACRRFRPTPNADDTLPGFTMSTFYEAYVGFKEYGWNGKAGEHSVKHAVGESRWPIRA